MAFQTLNFSNKMSSRISLEIKFWITFDTGPETRNFQGASAQIQLAQKGSIFPKKSLIFISKMAILGSFRGGSEVAFVTSVFFALSSVTYCSLHLYRIPGAMSLAYATITTNGLASACVNTDSNNAQSELPASTLSISKPSEKCRSRNCCTSQESRSIPSKQILSSV